MQEMTEATRWRLEIANEEELAQLALDVCALVKTGDFIALTGDLGVGKTTFARALIRYLINDLSLEVPSPTFTLMQAYESSERLVVHADFYRIASAKDLSGLGWDEIIDGAIALVEWAERAPEVLPKDRLEIHLNFGDQENPQARHVEFVGYGDYAQRLAPFKAVRDLLRQSGWGAAHRSFLQGDASTRAYEKLENTDGAQAIMMISPPRPDGPSIRYGKSYSDIARLAENVRPFVAVAAALRKQGVSAPEILASDLDAGVLLVEYLGSDGVVDADGPMSERYLAAAEVLARLHTQKLPDVIPVEDDGVYHIPPYDIDALLIEVELLLDWYIDHLKTSVSSGARAVFINIWRKALLDIAMAPTTWTLRDYHSPNLLWLKDRVGSARVGVIDFQDCVLGHPAYDLASLGQDARVSVPDALELKLLAHYSTLRRAADPDFNIGDFAKAYSILAAQRATKILGIFARLNQRDGKPQYLKHLPRIEAYLIKSLKHPALDEIKNWYKTNLPNFVDI